MKLLLILVIGLACWAVGNTSQSATRINDLKSHTQVNPFQGRIFSNEYMKLNLAKGWLAREVPNNPAAVNIVKGKYILYINPNASQASGVEGGRFSEISMGAKSADAVEIAPPSPECGTSHTSRINKVLSQNDLYINAREKDDYCKTPTNGKTVWYFSYVNNTKSGGYFNYYTQDVGEGYVITMAYNSAKINDFPQKDSKDLKSALGEMSWMIKSLEIKRSLKSTK